MRGALAGLIDEPLSPQKAELFCVMVTGVENSVKDQRVELSRVGSLCVNKAIF
jgi:hypothetical protein